MHFSATALVLVLRLVAAAPRHQTYNGNIPAKVLSVSTSNELAPQSIEAYIHTSESHKQGISKAIIQVDITTPSHSNPGISAPEISITQERIPGWLYFDGKRLQGRIHGNTFWNIKGELAKDFPIHEFLMDPVIFTLNHPTDFDGAFTGEIGRGEVSLKWEKSGATITGRSGAGDYTVEGKTHVDWSP
ncbi:hypothetical protein BKA65DRAFT_546502 [Rhexocercosporidium sp. MPI-PUGE-AT-0058]|nr:hypothetical protein BKA65DRAFT_546502 [Rhexocercosporidium sp. MPI-PUGE-AT-0058]